MIEVWCEPCRDWYPFPSAHALQFPRRGSTRYARRVHWEP
ncbi:hypothetical protein SEA_LITTLEFORTUNE_16 [Microbacterium phage LittleFortune]|uniref:Uncharacterized protein n=1 Tax=Microbacterium phage LittleFortune TaxID=3077164 RepID=A0AA96K5J1_9CAUD|nr:hypothetical protein SEA_LITTLEFORTUNE_16 [Microbacterium phage LittleFortune]